MTDPFAKKVQCKACPWRKGVVPSRDIPGGYDVEKHKGLCNLKEGAGQFEIGKIMACHETTAGEESACVGWLVHEMGDGNNIGLRIRAREIGHLTTTGEQHDCIEDTLG